MDVMSKFIKVTLDSNRERIAINADQIIFIEDGAYSPSKLNMIGGQSFTVLESLEQIEAQLLRDEFAMSFASGSEPSDYYEFKHLASDAYKFADAMLRERME